VRIRKTKATTRQHEWIGIRIAPYIQEIQIGLWKAGYVISYNKHIPRNIKRLLKELDEVYHSHPNDY